MPYVHAKKVIAKTTRTTVKSTTGLACGNTGTPAGPIRSSCWRARTDAALKPAVERPAAGMRTEEASGPFMSVNNE